MRPLERHIQASVIRRLKLLASLDPTLVWRKRHGSVMSVTGDPDLHGVWGGIPFEIELKAPGQSPTLLQSARLASWRRAGCQTFVVHSTSELDEALALIRRARGL